VGPRASEVCSSGVFLTRMCKRPRVRGPDDPHDSITWKVVVAALELEEFVVRRRSATSGYLAQCVLGKRYPQTVHEHRTKDRVQLWPPDIYGREGSWVRHLSRVPTVEFYADKLTSCKIRISA
jgi:hypothetical protein